MRFIRRISVFMMCLMFLVMASASWGTEHEAGTWTALQTALTNATNGDTIKLTANITAETALNITANISLDLNGYTLSRNLANSEDNGYVIYTSSNLKIMNGTITGGKNTTSGGGIYIYSGTFHALNCIFKDNTANQGGGIFSETGNLNIENCVFVGNTTEQGGGGMYTQPQGNTTLKDCTFIGNITADNGGGLNIQCGQIEGDTSTQAEIINCIFIGNTAKAGGGAYTLSYSTPPKFYHCAFINNTATGPEGETNSGGQNAYISSSTYIANSLFWNDSTRLSATSYDITCSSPLSLDNCAIPESFGLSGDNIVSTDSIYIPSWDNPISSDFTSHDVIHKIFTIEDNFTALSGLVGRGKFFSAESRDIRGNLFRNPPSIGPAEYYGDISIIITSRDNLAGWLGNDFIASVDIQPSGLAGKGSWDIPGLPIGLSSHDKGNTIVISGEPTQAGSFPAKITFRNGDYKASKDITITIKPVIISPDSVAVTDKVVLMSTDYAVKFSASPDITAGYSWDVSPLKSNDIAASIDKTGNFTLKGTNAKTGSFTFHITAKRNNLICGSADVILTVRDAHMSSLSADITTGNFSCDVGTATNLAANVRAIYENGTSSDIDAGNYGLTWSADINSSLFTFTGGALTATESAAGHSYDIKFTVTATHKTSASITGSANKTVRVTVNDIAPTFAQSSYTQSAVKGVNFSCDITASTGTNIKWSYTGNRPAGVTVSSADKKFTVSGTPARGSSGSYTINITATNTAGTQTATLTLTVKGGNITVERGNPSTTTTGGKTITSNATTFKNQGGQGISSADISITADTSDWHGFTGYSFRRVISVDVSIKSQDRNYPSWSADVLFEGMPTGFTHTGSTSYSGNDSSHKFVITVSGEPVNEIDTDIKVIARVRFPGGTYDSTLNTSCDKEIHIDIDNPSPVSLDINISGSKDITVKHGDTGTLTLAHSVRAYFNDGTNSTLSTGDYSTSWTTTATYTGITFSGGVLSVGGDAAIGSYNIPATLTATYNGATGSDDVTLKVTVTRPYLTGITVALSTDTAHTMKRGSSLNLEASVTETYSDNTTALSTDNYAITWSADNLPAGFTLEGSTLKAGMEAAIQTHNIAVNITATGAITKTESAMLAITVNPGEISSNKGDDIGGESSSRRVTTFTENPQDGANFNSVIFLSADITITTESDDFSGIEGIYFESPVSVDVRISQDTRYYTFTSYTLSLDVDGLSWLGVSGDNVMKNIPVTSSDFVFTLAGYPNESTNNAPVKITATVILSGDMELQASCDKQINVDIIPNAVTSLDVEIVSAGKTLTVIHGHSGTRKMSADVRAYYADGSSRDLGVNEFVPAWRLGGNYEGITISGGVLTVSNDAPVGSWDIPVIVSVDFGGKNATAQGTIHVTVTASPLASLNVEIISASKNITVQHGSSATLTLTPSVKAIYEDGTSIDLTAGEYASSWSISGSYTGITIADGVITVSGDAAIGEYDLPVILSADYGGKNGTAQGTIHVTVTDAVLMSLDVAITTARNITLKRGSSITFEATITERYSDGTTANGAGKYSLTWTAEGLPEGVSLNGAKLTAGMNAKSGAYSFTLTATASNESITGHDTDNFTLNVNSSGKVSQHTLDPVERDDEDGSHTEIITIFDEDPDDDEGGFDSAHFASADVIISTASYDLAGVQGMAFSENVSVEVAISFDADYYTFTAYDLSLDIDGPDWLKISGDGVIKNIPIQSRDFVFVMAGTPVDSGDFPATITAHVILSGDLELEASCDKTVNINIAENAMISLDVEISGDNNLTVIYGAEASADLSAIVTASFMNGQISRLTGGYVLTWSADNLPSGITLNNGVITIGATTNPGAYSLDITATATANSLTASDTFTVNATILNAITSLSVKISGDNALTIIKGNEATATLTATVTAHNADGTNTTLTSGYNLAWTHGTLPDGITFNDGTITITASANPGAYSLDITATATANSLTASDTFTVNATILNAITSLSVKISGDNALSVIKGNEATTTLTATITAHNADGTNTTLTSGYNLAWTHGTLPDGITFNDGTITITTAANPGAYSLDITATATANSLTASDTFTMNATILNAITSLSVKISGDNALTVIKGNEATATLTATITAHNADGTNTTLTSGYNLAWTHGTLPDGITFNNGTITITASANPGAYSLDITATATANSLTASDTFTVNATILNAITSLSVKISGDKSLAVVHGEEASTTLTATVTAHNSDGTSTILTSGYNLAWTHGTLPDGITFNDGTITITTAANPGAYSLDITATATANNLTASDTFTVNATILNAITSLSVKISGDKALTVIKGSEATTTLTATVTAQNSDGTNTTLTSGYNLVWSADNLPQGITFNDGTIAITPTANAGAYSIDITATATTAGFTATDSFTFRANVLKAGLSSISIDISGNNSASFPYSTGGTLTFTATATAIYADNTTEHPAPTWTYSGDLPEGFTFTQNDGVASLTASPKISADTYAVTLTATAQALTGQTVSRSVIARITINDPTISSLRIEPTQTEFTIKRGSSAQIQANVYALYEDGSEEALSDGYNLTWAGGNDIITLSESGLITATMKAANGNHSLTANATATYAGITGNSQNAITVTVESSGKIKSQVRPIPSSPDKPAEIITIFTEDPYDDDSDLDAVIFASADIIIHTEREIYSAVDGVKFSMPVSASVRISQDAGYYDFSEYDLTLNISGDEWLAVEEGTIFNIPLTSSDFTFTISGTPKEPSAIHDVKISALAEIRNDTGDYIEASADKVISLAVSDAILISISPDILTSSDFTMRRGSSTAFTAKVTGKYSDGTEEILPEGSYILTWSAKNLPAGMTFTDDGTLTAGVNAPSGEYTINITATASSNDISGNDSGSFTVNIITSGRYRTHSTRTESEDDSGPFTRVITREEEDGHDDGSGSVILASADIIIQTSSDVYAVYVGENVNIPASVDVAISFDESLCKLTGYTLSFNANGASWLNVSRNTITAEISDSPQNSVFTLSGVPSTAGEYPVRLIASVNVSGDIPLTASANKIIRLNVTKESRSWITGRIITNSITLAPGESSAIIAEITRHDSNGAKNILGTGEYSAVWSGAGLADFMTLTQSGLLRVSESAQAGTYDITANAQVSCNGENLTLTKNIAVTIQTSGSDGGGTISPVNLSDDTEQTSQRVHEEPIQPGAAQGLLRITSGRPGYGEIYKYYTHKFTADAGGLEGALTWRITAGSLPSGIELDTSSGKISGESQEAGNFRFTISVSAGGIGETEQSVTLRIRDVRISDPSSPSSMWKCTLTPSAKKAKSKTFKVQYRDTKATNVEFHSVSFTGYKEYFKGTSANAGVSALTFKGRNAIVKKPYKAQFNALNNANIIRIKAESTFYGNSFGYHLTASDFADEVDAGITVVIGDMASSDALSIETLPLTAEQMQEVTRIEFVSSDITSISGIFATFPNLSELSFTNCPNITALNVGNSRLVWLDVAECEKLSEIIASGCNALIVLDVSECESLKAVNVSGCSTLDTLTLNGTGIEALDASGCVELVNMDISESENLASLNLTGCIALEILNISHTQINALDVSGMAGLRELYADGTMITAIDASTCPAITDLSFANAESFAALNVEGCENLARLDVSGTAIREVNVQDYKRLVYLDAGGCLQMSNIDVTGCASLDAINVAGSLIEELDLTGCPNITLIRADGCENMTLLKAEECMNLRDVHMKGTVVGNLNFTGHESLRHLDVSSCTFLNELCLTKCYSLQTLNCTGCDLPSLDLKDCYSLIALYCGGNSIASLDLDGMNSLTGITCSGNGLAKLNLDGLISLDAASCGEQLVTGQIMMAQMNMKALVLNDIDRIISLRGYNSWDVEISADYDRESGMATFAETPLVVAYEYDTGFSTESGDVIMNVTVTGDPNVSTLGPLRGGCDTGVGVFGAIAVMIFLAPKKRR